jgi:hypothetical protein
MNDTAVTTAVTSKTSLPFPTNEERDALVLEFQRLSARLTQAGLISSASATRLMRSMNRERRDAEDRRHALPKLIQAILLGVESGTLKERDHFVRPGDERLALHLESIAQPLFRAHDTSWNAREMRRLFRFGWLHFRAVVVARSDRARFGPEEDRRRVVVLHVPSAYEFVGRRPNAVPAR